ncbi:MAG: nickel pincer cofactor biosynthesis protein LarC [Actinomycetota bacterium]|nr:nickel pincer cofactor biosynthesis protein LarC [Actinomycetota bacterium]
MRVLYFDCVSGAAGDMILGALIDAGAPLEEVRSTLDLLGLDGWELHAEAVTRGGISATKAHVLIAEDKTSRTFPEIERILSRADLPERVATRSLEAFLRLAHAEGKVHGRPFDEVHFHEVGAVDALIDIVGAFAALELLTVDRITTSAIPLGSGHVNTAHGVMPVPAPAVVELLAGAAVRGGGEGELVTPTGAAILAVATDSFGPMPPMRLQMNGCGAGSRDLDAPNVLRVLIGEALPSAAGGGLVIETNIDDMSPELLPHVLDTLLTAGAQDAWITPIQMKKGRWGVTLSVLTSDAERDRIADLIYRETTTLGMRFIPVSKDALEREWVEVTVGDLPVRVKLGIRGSEPVTVAPEYDDAMKAARATGLPLKEVYARATEAARSRIGERRRAGTI